MRRAHRELIGTLGDEIVESKAALFAAGYDYVAQFGHILADRIDLLDAVGLDQNRLGRAVIEAILERIGTEQLGDWQCDRANPIKPHVRNRGLGPLRQMDRDHVAALDSQPNHRVGKATAEFAHLAEGVGLDPALVILVVERRFIAQVGMAIEAIDGDVVIGRDVPSMARASLGKAFRAADGLFAKANDAHGEPSDALWGAMRSAQLYDAVRPAPRSSVIRPRKSINLVSISLPDRL